MNASDSAHHFSVKLSQFMSMSHTPLTDITLVRLAISLELQVLLLTISRTDLAPAHPESRCLFCETVGAFFATLSELGDTKKEETNQRRLEASNW